MFIESISLKKLFQSKKTMTLVCIFSLLLILILAIFTWLKVSKILNGNSINDIREYIGEKKDNIFNMKSYDAEYTMVVVSNKNINSYVIREIYDSGKTRYEYLDSMSSKIILIVNKDKIKIQNENQKNILIQDFENVGLSNTFSISTFLDIYNNNKGMEDNINVKEYLKNGCVRIIMQINEVKKENSGNEKFINMFKGISRVELEIDDKTKLPVTYVVYNKNKKEVISIVYTKFNINPKVDSKIFDIY